MSQRIDAIKDRAIRLGYRCAYQVLRLWWSLRRPATQGAAIALWHEGKVLMIRTSYRDCYSLPGGFVGKGESAEHAACREVFEEIGVDLSPTWLHHAWHGTLEFESRRDTMDIWEAWLDWPPAIHISGREIVWAGWMDPGAALGRRLLPHVAEYLAQR